MRGWNVLLTLPVLLAGVAGCGAETGNGTASGVVRVVAAENFWGDLASQVGGSRVSVTSIVSSPDADPHLFEPGSRSGLSVAGAKVVIRNGAGYDQWMDKLLAAAPAKGRRVVTVAQVVGVHGPDPNPHLWYDTPALPAVIAAVADALSQADPEHAAGYEAGARRAIAGLAPLQAAVIRLKAEHAGAPVAYTERVPGLLLAAAGLRVLTPASFARAVEDGSDPSPRDVAAMRSLLTGRRVKALLYNEQATSPLTEALRQAAASAGVPVVAVTETEPPGSSFLSWQLAQVNALAAALGS